MKTATDWEPDSYLRFADERTQPSVDLVSRIHGIQPSTIIDVGCGPGNSTKVLSSRWPESRVLCIDSSPAMIGKASRDYPETKWKVTDAREITGNFDLVYSNATIQWIGSHEKLIPFLFSRVAEGGALAVQIPLYFDMPVKKAIDRTAARFPSRHQFPDLEDLMTIHPESFYYDLLAPLSRNIDLWKTSYIHVMESHRSIVEMIATTGMKPYLDELDSDDEKKDFGTLVLSELESAYEKSRNGKVLFSFERLFFVAYR